MKKNNNERTKSILCQVRSVAKGRMKVQVLDAQGHVKIDRPWQNNLILNSGLNYLCTGTDWYGAFSYCLVGTGVTDTAHECLEGETGSGSVDTFTGPAGFDFTAYATVGDMIKMTTGSDTGAEVRITAINSATSVTYYPSGNIAAGEFTVYHTSQTQLANAIKSTNTLVTGAGITGTTSVGNTHTMRRTFEFSAEVAPITYEEVGFSWGGTIGGAGQDLFSRIKLTVPVSLIAEEQLRVTYDLAVTNEPATAIPKTFNITGWPVAPSSSLDGDEQWQAYGLRFVTPCDVASGGWSTMAPYYTYTYEQPSSVAKIILSTFSGPPSAYGSGCSWGSNYAEKNVTLVPYTPLNFFRDKTVTFTTLEANRSDWRSMHYGSITPGTCLVCIFDEPQTKVNTHKLTLTFRFAVGRVLG